MVLVVVLSSNGEKRNLKTGAFTHTTVSGELIAKSLRKIIPGCVIGQYSFNESVVTVWGWITGKAGTENKHELPPFDEGENGIENPLLFPVKLFSVKKITSFAIFS